MKTIRIDLNLSAGRRKLDALADGTMQPEYVEQAEVGHLILALLERIQRLEEAQLGQRQGE